MTDLNKNNHKKTNTGEQYFIPLPFGEDISVSKEEREKRNKEQEQVNNKKEQENKRKIEIRDSLKKLGYTNAASNGVGNYGERLIKVFNNQNVANINEAKMLGKLRAQATQIGENATKDSMIQLFSGNQTMLHKNSNDFYTNKINTLLDAYEQESIYRFLSEDEIGAIEQLMITGNILDPALFARVEDCKRKNMLHMIRRTYTYGMAGRFSIPRNKPTQTSHIRNRDMQMIIHYLDKSGSVYNPLGFFCDIQDIDDEKLFLDRVESSFKQDIRNDLMFEGSYQYVTFDPNSIDVFATLPQKEQEKIQAASILTVGRRNSLLKEERNHYVRILQNKTEDVGWIKSLEKNKRKYGGFHSSRLQQTLGIQKEDLEQRSFQAKKESIQNIYNIFRDVKTQDVHLEMSMRNAYMKIQGYHISFSKLALQIDQINIHQKSYNLDINISELKNNICDLCIDIYQKATKRIEDKDPLNEWEDYWLFTNLKRDPESRVTHLLRILKELYKLIEELDSDKLVAIENFETLKTKTKDTYKEHFLNEKFSKILGKNIKISDVNKSNVSDIENVLARHIRNRFLEFRTTCISDRQFPNFEEDRPLIMLTGVYDIITQINTQSGDTPLIDVKQFEKKILYKSIHRIIEKLSTYKTFKTIDVESLHTLTREYISHGGKKDDISIDRNHIDNIYFSKLQKRTDFLLQQMERLLYADKQERSDYVKPYEIYIRISNEIGQFLNHAMSNHNKQNTLKGFQISDIYKHYITKQGRNIDQDNIPDHIHIYINEIFTQMEPLKNQALKNCVGHRMQESRGVDGRIHRLIREKIFDTSGPAILSDSEKVQFVLEYLSENLSEMIWNDFTMGILGRSTPYFEEKNVIEDHVSKLLNEMKQRLQAENDIKFLDQ